MATGHAAASSDAMPVDPVCGSPVADGPDALHATVDQVTYTFCTEACRREFLHKPERYVSSLSFQPGRHASG